jgi:type VI secretion system secreted protein Hcp
MPGRKSLVVTLFAAFAAAIALALVWTWGPKLEASNAAPQRATADGELVIEDLGISSPISTHGFDVRAPGDPATGGSAGKAEFGPLVVRKAVDAGTAPLLEAAATGKHLSKVVVRVFEAGSSSKLVTYKLTGGLITGVEHDGNKASAETVTVRYAKVTVSAEGEAFCFDLQTHSSC